MLKNGVVTLFTPDSCGENYVKKGVFDAWIYSKKRLRSTEKGVYHRDDFDVRISLEKLDEVLVGDLVYFGEITEEQFSMAECRRVAAVSKNCFGKNPHWHLQAEYEYR